LSDVPSIDAEELARWQAAARPFTLLDVREADEVEYASIPGSTHIPMRDVRARIAEIQSGLPIVVVCHFGERSAHVARALIAAGIPDVYNLAGGIDAYSLSVDPSVPRY
jgi:rhodanese-related sulfurtransferase